MTLTFEILGVPRTKKNSLRRIRRGVRTFTVSSEAHRGWEQYAILQLRQQLHRYRGRTFHEGQRWNMKAIVYRDRDVGDLLNYLAAISDVLENAAAVADDKQIIAVDGSRLSLDRARPRVEIELTEVA